jgi:hypothetical protein
MMLGFIACIRTDGLFILEVSNLWPEVAKKA